MDAHLWQRLIEILPIGLASGLLAGAFGIGGGIVSVPLVRHLLGVPAHVAVGSTLAVILPTAIVAVLNYRKEGSLKVGISIACCLPAALSTIFASHLSRHVEGKVLMLFLAGLMVLVGLDFLSGFAMKLKEKTAAGQIRLDDRQAEFEEHSGNENVSEKKDFRSYLIAAAIGLVVGLLSGFLGIGGGFIMVPAFCYFLDMPLKTAFGTSLLVIAVVALPGTVVHFMHSHVDFALVLPLLIGSIPGARIGSNFSLKSKEKTLRMAFGILVLIMALVFAYKEINP